MPRPRKSRRCCLYQADRIYKPQGIPMTDLGTVEMTLDEFEALRFCDLDELDQAEAAAQMGVSRGTIQRLLWSARRKLVSAILNNDALIVNLRQGEDCHVGMHTHQRRQRAGRGAV